MLFEDKEISTLPVSDDTGVSIDLTSLDRDYFRNYLRGDYGSIEAKDLPDVVLQNIDNICSDLLNDTVSYADIFKDQTFIRTLIRVLSTIQIQYTWMIGLNKMIYAYLSSEDTEETLKTLYNQLAEVINRDKIAELMTTGIDKVTAINLAFYRYSSPNERVNSKRLNFILCLKDPDVMTEQRLIYIYEKLYDRITDLFIATMFEYYTVEAEANFGGDFLEIYANISLAVLAIVNNMPLDSITRLLTAYSEEWISKGKPNTRFSLRSLSADYSRVRDTAESLNAHGVEIP